MRWGRGVFSLMKLQRSMERKLYFLYTKTAPKTVIR